MPLLAFASDDVRPEHIKKSPMPPSVPNGPHGTITSFPLPRDSEASVSPTVFMAKWDPNRISTPHYHSADQFQLVIDGQGTIGRRAVAPYYVHFTRAYTPYGPLVAGERKGWTFLALRARRDGGSQHGSAAMEKLKRMPNRRPFQVSKQVTFPLLEHDRYLYDVPEFKDEYGLFVKMLALKSHGRLQSPSPAMSDGQYLVALEGSLVYGAKEYRGISVIFIKPDDPPFEIEAGSLGLRALILEFPKNQ